MGIGAQGGGDQEAGDIYEQEEYEDLEIDNEERRPQPSTPTDYSCGV